MNFCEIYSKNKVKVDTANKQTDKQTCPTQYWYISLKAGVDLDFLPLSKIGGV